MEIFERVGFRQTCEVCDTWLHSCVHCSFWSGISCTETSADKIGDPEAQNFCEWYREIDLNSAGERKTAGTKEDAEDLWRKLTKK